MKATLSRITLAKSTLTQVKLAKMPVFTSTLNSIYIKVTLQGFIVFIHECSKSSFIVANIVRKEMTKKVFTIGKNM